MFSEHPSTLHLSPQSNTKNRVQYAPCDMSRSKEVVAAVLHEETAIFVSPGFRSDKLSGVVLEKPLKITVCKGQKMPAVEMNVILEED